MEIELTHPLVGSTAAADNDQINKNLVSNAEDSWKESHFIVNTELMSRMEKRLN